MTKNSDIYGTLEKRDAGYLSSSSVSRELDRARFKQALYAMILGLEPWHFKESAEAQTALWDILKRMEDE